MCCQKKYLKAIVMTSISRDSNNTLEQQKKKKASYSPFRIRIIYFSFFLTHLELKQ